MKTPEVIRYLRDCCREDSRYGPSFLARSSKYNTPCGKLNLARRRELNVKFTGQTFKHLRFSLIQRPEVDAEEVPARQLPLRAAIELGIEGIAKGNVCHVAPGPPYERYMRILLRLAVVLPRGTQCF